MKAITITCIGGVHGDCESAVCHCACHRLEEPETGRVKRARKTFNEPLGMACAAAVNRLNEYQAQRQHQEALCRLVGIPLTISA